MKSDNPLAVLLLLTAFLSVPPALAYNNTYQENKLLKMYFDEEELVETATRSPKPITQVAENVTIVTAEKIEAMHAHTLAEVLNRQSGVFVDFFGQDFLGDSILRLLGSQRHHVLLLLDGVRLNINSSGAALTNFIPISIIKRIEIIKGAASSTWGSALGGVINIITKDVANSSRPTGNVNVSYGEGNSRDVSADVAGKLKALGYYLHVGNIDSDGLSLDRYSERNSLYGKMQLELPRSSRLSFTAGYSDPFYKNLNWGDAWEITDLNIYEDIDHQSIWGTLYFDTEITQDLTFHLSGQHFDNTFSTSYNSLGSGLGGHQGDLIFGEKWKEEVNSFIGRLTWAREAFTANLGFESSRSEMKYASRSGIFFDGPSLTEDDPVTESRHGTYANVTYVKGNFSITPGLRYDDHSNSEESVNPSLGITYLFGPDILLRGSIAKGFSAPYLAASSHSPNLEPENIWAYQAGIETGRIPYLHFKGTIFYHNIEDAWDYNMIPWVNTGSIRLNGFEVEAKTAVYHGLSLSGNFTYIKEKSKETSTSAWVDDETYTSNFILSYRNTAYGLRTEVASHYYWMSDHVTNEEPKYGTFLWDILLAKDVDFSLLSGEVYLKGHNIFNGDQYIDFEYPNPKRWLEVGLALKF
ncbi:vitamin B12 transporter [Candidatus Electrothrix aarhusensis]|jgi:vitamin B12 transporter|uniref:Vitamin B12 transporter n=1 Tax=Candidatus Electrothrix aarhusensis TaxID=1859131 RepID=A0A3S3QE23_9BACT|nr:vitamin B12 transporter [Candidatus Electrothrix aarhusensis]